MISSYLNGVDNGVFIKDDIIPTVEMLMTLMRIMILRTSL